MQGPRIRRLRPPPERRRGVLLLDLRVHPGEALQPDRRGGALPLRRVPEPPQGGVPRRAALLVLPALLGERALLPRALRPRPEGRVDAVAAEDHGGDRRAAAADAPRPRGRVHGLLRRRGLVAVLRVLRARGAQGVHPAPPQRPRRVLGQLDVLGLRARALPRAARRILRGLRRPRVLDGRLEVARGGRGREDPRRRGERRSRRGDGPRGERRRVDRRRLGPQRRRQERRRSACVPRAHRAGRVHDAVPKVRHVDAEGPRVHDHLRLLGQAVGQITHGGHVRGPGQQGRVVLRAGLHVQQPDERHASPVPGRPVGYLSVEPRPGRAGLPAHVPALVVRQLEAGQLRHGRDALRGGGRVPEGAPVAHDERRRHVRRRVQLPVHAGGALQHAVAVPDVQGDVRLGPRQGRRRRGQRRRAAEAPRRRRRRQRPDLRVAVRGGLRRATAHGRREHARRDRPEPRPDGRGEEAAEVDRGHRRRTLLRVPLRRGPAHVGGVLATPVYRGGPPRRHRSGPRRLAGPAGVGSPPGPPRARRRVRRADVPRRVGAADGPAAAREPRAVLVAGPEEDRGRRQGGGRRGSRRGS
mmetsp:Transcript_27093/g.87735  ORF Transcript_27093/g.87735 Transcript_27093/m.87735 type:complete len:583 (-) Transcript_27093:1149-2897(-)